ncbi:MAG: phosphopantetheine-binding protein [Solirubrobacterales bacterium]
MQPRSDLEPPAVRARIREVILEMAPIASAEAAASASLTVDLGFDSLRLVELATALEDEFGLAEADEDDVAGIETVGDVEDLILRLLDESRNGAGR